MAAEFREYHAAANPGLHVQLKDLHRMITQHFPGAKQEMRHGMPHYVIDDSRALAYAARAKHCQVYFCELELTDDWVERLGNLKSGKQCVKFAGNRNMPYEEVRELFDEIFSGLAEQI